MDDPGEVDVDQNSSVVSCLWCGRSAPEVKMSNEHVFRRRFRELMEPPALTKYATSWYRATTPGHPEVDRDMPVSPWEWQLREVCEPCNRWSDREVERPIEALLAALMLDQPVCLLPGTRLPFATWAAKTAIVRGAVDRGERAIPSSYARQLRETAAPPPFTRVLLGRAEAPENTWGRHLRFGSWIGSGYASSHSTTFLLGNMLVHVDGTVDQLARRLLDEVSFPSSWMQCMAQVWPERRWNTDPVEPVPWPRGVLSADAVVELSGWVSRGLGAPPGLTGR